ncbi:MAG: hypothetical protein M3Y50_03405, partial [Acidobacteriota bacterium]|nr:hypothetical protein [Acidobacteriota bacterium]
MISALCHTKEADLDRPVKGRKSVVPVSSAVPSTRESVEDSHSEEDVDLNISRPYDQKCVLRLEVVFCYFCGTVSTLLLTGHEKPFSRPGLQVASGCEM